jgi:hypothetical protein
MRYRFMASFVALLTVLALTHILFAQNSQPTQEPNATSTKAEPFDPHDISGIWKNPGGFDAPIVLP